MLLFVGLGNPGEKYARNRHNIGFMAVDAIAARHGFTPWRRRFQGRASEGVVEGVKVVLLKPDTYMNDSGRAVGEAARFLKLGEAAVVVFHDELDLLPGRLKVKRGGGNAGHNGLRSTSAHIGNEYWRVRIGIGHPGQKDLVTGYVLHDFAKADRTWIEPLLDAIAAAAGWLARGDGSRFQSEVARLAAAEESADATAAESDKAPAEAKATKPASGHPAGERMGKRQSALAENLKRWLSQPRGKK
jgi:PTH1 family peptidyl-tRNA hydrolase